jgi:type II secretory pathway pseudopilin PulG
MKTPPILLKILHNSAAKPSPNFNKTVSRKSEAGFTLLELIVIVLILGVLSSIAAPSWLAFINRQRVRTVNDRVFQSLRSAQSEAKRSKRDVKVTFYYAPNPPANPVADPPTVEIDTTPAETDPLKKEIRKETFSSEGEIKPRTIAISTNAISYTDTDGYAVLANSIVFDYKGNVKQLPLDSTTNKRRLVVSVAPFDTSVPGFPPNSSAQKCVIVETILGGMRTDEGKFNASTGQGCR